VAAMAPVAATRRAASPTAGTVRTAMWEAVAALALEVTALHLAGEVTAPAVQAAALPTADLDRAVTLDTTRAAAPVEASTTGALAAAVGSSIIRMEAVVSR